MFFLSLLLTFNLHGEVFEGYTLFTPKSVGEDGASTRLMNNNYEILHTWSHNYGPASMPYLLPDGSIIYPYRVPSQPWKLVVRVVVYREYHGMETYYGNTSILMIIFSTSMM